MMPGASDQAAAQWCRDVEATAQVRAEHHAGQAFMLRNVAARRFRVLGGRAAPHKTLGSHLLAWARADARARIAVRRAAVARFYLDLARASRATAETHERRIARAWNRGRVGAA